MEIKEFIEKFAEQFDDTDISEIKPETLMSDLDEWSSMIGLSLLNMVDNEYGVKLTFDELRNAITVQNLFDIVEKKQNHD
jgi:acyl carrier protein